MTYYWGATADDVAQRLQGSQLDITAFAIGATTGTARIERIMDRAKGNILGKIDDKKTLNFLQWGVIEGHKVIDNVQNVAQTAVDNGQGFIGTVDTDTFKIDQNVELTSTEEGLASSNYDITTNVLTVSATKLRGDTFYAYYTVDPDTVEIPQLAELIIEWSALILGREEVFGGSGDDGGLSDFVETTILPNFNEQLMALQENTSISKLTRLNLAEPFENPNTATSVRTCRGW